MLTTQKAQIIDGKAMAQGLRQELKGEVEALKKRGVEPALTVLLVGEDPASKVYVRNKARMCEEVGIRSTQLTLGADTTQQELLARISALNNDPSVHGILVQLPLPAHIDADAIIEAISPVKDVDGFHPYNMGRLVAGRPLFQPCTPLGVMKMLDSIGCDLKGKEAVIIGRSNIVGKPLAFMLLQKHATITICHSRTRDLPGRVLAADIVVAAVGKAEMVKGDWIKPGAVVIDVGINRAKDGKLIGDVEFEEALSRASWITPVPGGVGPMTIAMLLHNTVAAAARATA